MRIWVTGSRGLIGSHVLRQVPLKEDGIDAVGVTRTMLELQDVDQIERLFQEGRPDGIIHCAAIANTAVCEKEPELAQRVNVAGTVKLAELAAELPFVFLSTDIVFDGQRGNYGEGDHCQPVNVYGRTKREAEVFIEKNPKHCVLRLSLNGGQSPTGDRGFNEVLRRAFAEGREVKLFVDEYRQPLPATVTADVAWRALLERWDGIYHVGGGQKLSRFEIGELVAERHRDLDPKLIPVRLRDFRGGKRAPDTSMNCSRLEAKLGESLPGLEDWLAHHPNVPF